ncbi:MAG TPA: hypothetical protein VGM90_33900 [Kofleriaceae bacterium]|jgi:tetratricopeptide (TPR) repeat protein
MLARSLVLVAALLGSSVVMPRIAHADDKPWAQGVSAEKQKKALALYREGNSFFQQAQYKEALAKYELALAEWDHPLVRYNAAVCLINLDRLPAAWDDLEAAVRFGDAPLGKELFDEARRYQRQLAADTGTLEITCNVPGADVQLDGAPVMTGPGKVTKRLAKGTHRIVTTKEPDYVTGTQSVQIEGGRPQSTTIALAKREVTRVVERTQLERRWSPWKPYAVIGGGAAVAGVGGVMMLLARSQFSTFDDFSTSCGGQCSKGDPGYDAAKKHYDRGYLERGIGTGALVVGGAAVATGIVLVFMNQPREVQVAPTVEHPGVAILGRF